MYDVYKRVLCLGACAVGLGVSTLGALGAEDAEVVTKTWTLTLPEDATGITNKAPVTLTDGNYTLRGWIRDAAKQYLAIGGRAAAASKAEGLALTTDADGKFVGSGDLDLRGAVTVDGESSAWTITHIGQKAFFQVYDAPFDVCILPTTLRSMDSETFQSCGAYSGFKDFRIVAPELTDTLPNNTFLINTYLTKVMLRIPKVTRLGGYWNRTGYDNFMAETDVSDWDLASVQMLYHYDGNRDDRKADSFLFRFSKFRGTMRLPSLKILNSRTFLNCPNLNALEAGRNGTLEYVGYSAATNCPALGSVVLGGAAAGWTISSNAFNAVNLTNVTFLTTPPAYEEAETVVFGTAETPARQIAFHIPPRGTRGWDANWSRFARAARAPADDERAAFAERFGAFAAEGLVGLVPPALFRTAREQWLVCGRSPVLRHAVRAAVFDPRFDGDAVEVSPAPDADGRYAAGTRVTLTARPDAAKGRFVRWRGTVPEAREEEASLTLVLDRDLDLTAQFAHDWTFTPMDPQKGFVAGGGYISNQVWKLAVTVTDAAKGEIQYGRWATGSAWTDFGEGMLDLNGRVLWTDETGDTRELAVTGYTAAVFQGPGQTVEITVDGKKQKVYREYIPVARYPRALVLRENLDAPLTQVFRYHGSGGPVTNLVFECPTMTDNPYTDGFCGYAMRAGRLRIPRITRVPAAYTWSLGDVDVSDWRLDAITDVVGELTGDWGVYKGMFAGGQTFTGTLHLPALATVQTNAFRAASKMEAVELGSNTVVTSIGTKAFKGCSSLARIRVRAGADLAVGEDAFEGTTGLKILEFTFEAPKDPTAVDNMLAGTAEEVAASANPPVIYASRALGWSGAKIANIQPPTDAERAACPFWVKQDGTLLGVWRTAAGARKAWVVHVPSPDDPRGTYLFLR
ncbi:MAG: leucine-rich repeat protein [bacterium]|nr:leucine-rich repeat protein [bacterium]